MITRLNTQRLFFGFLLCVATVYIGGCVEHKGDVLGQATEAMHAGQFTNAEQLLSDNIADADSPLLVTYQLCARSSGASDSTTL